jgi:predicted NBD/HSP70 family sugar kinase
MILAIDIGGTKTLLGIFELNGTLKESLRFETPSAYSDFVEKLQNELPKFIGKTHINECVVGVPAKLDREKGVAIAFGNRPWENVPIQSDIKRILGVPTRVENDAKLAGLSEALLLPQYRRVFYVTISTGIGGGFVIDGHLDANTIDSEVGHMMLEHEGRIQSWESFASGKAIYEKFGQKASEIENPSTWYIVARNIAIGLIDVIATLSPEAIVMGGGVGTHLHKFKDKLLEELELYSSNVVNIPTIYQAQKPEEAVLYGCYALAHKDTI